ncbi:cytochrome ubiquinol oxidase subunit I [Nocardioides campestrisoli]|uniref:cytochrome ubiquinol oxidase subunit I n=1 Tax=Nocardioides campestrisoli TaxID=2736757 RepID=UPI00281250E1|nr:cytochrome ubiquinol oxidase subunit I [Nocardioides campestrisoli]
MSLPEVLLQVVAAEEPAGLFPARLQMAFSLGWHIVLACFGVGFPAMIFTMHWRGIYRDDADALVLAQRWAKVSAVLFAVGAVSGTVLSFEMGLLWPGLMGPFGDVLGLPFAFEGLAFFTEAIFLGIYLYGWGRMPPERHLLTILPMAVAGLVGTFCVVSVNAWMNVPAGFRIVDGEVVDINPWRAMFNDLAFLQFLHMWVAAFMVVGFLAAGVYAVGMLRGRRDALHRKGFIVPFTFGSVAAFVQPFVGHFLGGGLADRQPAKLAAFELSTTTEAPAPLRLGGLLIDGEAKWSIDIPYIGSLIARNSFDAPVPGLDTVPVADQPPVNITHLSFQLMVGIGFLLMLVVLVYWIARWRGKDLLGTSWFLRAVAVAGPLAVIAVEAGWTATEVGRQPWVVYGVLRTADAADSNGWLWWLLGATFLLYAAMTVAATVVIRSMTRRWRSGSLDLPSPYGPQLRERDTQREVERP